MMTSTPVLMLVTLVQPHSGSLTLTKYSKVHLCNSQHQLAAVKGTSHCRPILKVINLPLPGNNTIQRMTPQHIEVPLCGGGCYNVKHSCVSTSKKTRQVPVILSKCGVGTGTCEKECATIVVEEDTGCKCDCLESQKAECRTDEKGSHRFNENACRCECRNQDLVRLCMDQGRIWDGDQCVCRCPVSLVKPCSTGYIFDHYTTCSCVPEDVGGKNNSVTDERVERSEAASVTLALKNDSVEIVIIVTLAGVASVFFLIIISLLNNIRTLRQTIKNMTKNIRLDLYREERIKKTNFNEEHCDQRLLGNT